MSALRVAMWAWLVGGVLWLVKLALIAENGGTNTAEGAVAVAFVAGVVVLVAAGAASGYALLRRWNVWLAVLGVPVGAAVVLVGFGVLDGILQSIVPAEGWFEEEVGILGFALLAVAIGLALVLRGRARVALSRA